MIGGRRGEDEANEKLESSVDSQRFDLFQREFDRNFTFCVTIVIEKWT